MRTNISNEPSANIVKMREVGSRPCRLRQNKKRPSKTVFLVEAAGLEPTVSSTRNWRDTTFATPRKNIYFLLFDWKALALRHRRIVESLRLCKSSTRLSPCFGWFRFVKNNTQLFFTCYLRYASLSFKLNMQKMRWHLSTTRILYHNLTLLSILFH